MREQRSGRSLIYIGLIFILSMMSMKSYSYDQAHSFSKEDIEERYLFLSQSDKKNFHFKLIKALEFQSLRTKYSEPKINVKFSQVSEQLFFKQLERLLLNTAHAQDSYLYCSYGGWMSMMNSAKECLPPWSRTVRANNEFSSYGPVYDGSHSCGGARLFRCNPVLFGGAEDGKGHCVTTDDGDPKLTTTACLENMTSEQTQEHLKALEDNPEVRAQYLTMAAEVMRFCDELGGRYSYCEELSEMLSTNSEVIAGCFANDELYRYLPDLVTPLNSDQLDEIARGLGTSFSEYQEDLERRQFEAMEANQKIYEDAIKSYTVDARTRAMIEKLDSNLGRCIQDSCRGRKSRTRSVAYCLRYVKHGMLAEGSYLESYPWTRYAADSGGFLKEAGFTNLMDVAEMNGITPENAPVGAVIVYEKARGSRTPGHIEVKTGDSEYMSDFVTSTPTRLGGARRPIGVYVKLPDDIDKELRSVPEY